ncbi:FumA C-terminus/TtdB family hydratase beta subunit [Methanobrevibacter olleyae]|uniref:Fumarate hydratase FumA n=1 Tax=Methanobrevibacter olleyae TaxID=294671 RepID=A0A126QYW2_METOL|nr:FumA C-terminus/TtdB family hydratase beta subunit [Methanobrevibacter olleyae]AMK14987.1 fumarate hydratase FumA [Methanobrevibacter olleyae]SFL62994.1 fumarate hydratase subunit beta [Methanobrevibacter olleyae]
MIELNTPISDDDINQLKAGDVITISGQILTARDQAHKRILEEGAPCDIKGAVLFHAGPIIKEEKGINEDSNSISEPKYKMVAVGPTTSMRMNPYEADVLDMGAKIIIGKGGMDDSVREALKRNNAVYVVATGGCAALYVDKVNEIKGVKWLDLGMPEAIWDLDVDSFGPLIVAMDSEGKSLYD